MRSKRRRARFRSMPPAKPGSMRIESWRKPPLLDHFHPPLHGPRRWEGFHHAWATFMAQQLNQGVLPPDYFAESEISVGPEMEIDVATLETATPGHNESGATPATWTPPKPKLSVQVDF